jgi:hypothetical protein
VKAREHGLDENLPYWFSTLLPPALQEQRHSLSVIALFEDGTFLHVQ